MNRHKVVLITIVCLIPMVLYGQSHHNLSHPESVIKWQNEYLVSNIGAKLDAQIDGDGYISRVDVFGNVLESQFLPPKGISLNAPKGMALVNNTLFVTDLQRILGFNLKTKALTFLLHLNDEALFLNDIVVVSPHELLVSDSFADAIFKVDTQQKTYTRLATGMAGANGLLQAHGKVYAVTSGKNIDGKGKLYEYVTETDTFMPIDLPVTGILDGVQAINHHQLLISDWVGLSGEAGHFYQVDLIQKTVAKSALSMISPADFLIDPVNQSVVVPQTLTHQVHVLGLKNLFPRETNHNKLFHYGLIDGFLGGLYEGDIAVGQLLEKGNFGLGAPNWLDGELTVLDGKPVQTVASGQTGYADTASLAAYAFVVDFSPDGFFSIDTAATKNSFEDQLLASIPKDNALYAIKATGNFTSVTTRAFPPVKNKPYPRLATMLNRQKFFEHEHTNGTLVGFYLPKFMNGINVPGFHFHFVSDDLQQGGHVVALECDTPVRVQIDRLDQYEIKLPENNEFHHFDFSNTKNTEIQQVESGGVGEH